MKVNNTALHKSANQIFLHPQGRFSVLFLAFLQTRVFRLAAKIEEFMPIENPAGVARQDWDNEPAALLMSAIKDILIDGSRQAPDRRHSRKIRKNAHKKTHTYRLVRESGAATLQLALFRWKTAGKTCRSQLKLESDRSKVEQETNYHKTFSVTSALAQHPTKRAAASRRSGARQNVGDVTDRCFHYDVIGCETVTSE
ncbi:hypothetical protein GEV33_005539 [Tenebrio molitor]|uniref:Uncharacterized protein n=1 Tax=Tenebrio molitor TaxID=7067 RepID=A0A8J6LFA5_TENMO|nr:hypothetical protein GEV33_005539 [Tenebrio molitor]